MRVLIAALSVLVAVQAYDAVYFSNNNDVSSIQTLLSSASSSEPLVFIVNPDFTLGQFSVKANAYSAQPSTDYLAKSVKNAKFQGSQYFASQLSASSAQVITDASQYTAGKNVYVLAGEEWTSMETLAQAVLSNIENPAAVVITSTDAISQDKTRVKRVATDEMNDAATGETGSTGSANVALDQTMPVVLPPYNITAYNVHADDSSSCLFYLEGLTVVVQQKVDTQYLYAAAPLRDSNLTWGYADGDVNCQNGTIGDFLFRVRLSTAAEASGYQDNTKRFTIPSGQVIDFTLNITGDFFGYWTLSGATLHSASVVGEPSSSFKSASASEAQVGVIETQFTGINSVAGFSLVCGETQAIFFPTSDPTVRIGIALVNTQVQTFALLDTWKTQGAHFTWQAEDCTGTFSSGSWMGIISSLVLIGGLLFGYMMLQSVQTQDRYDDPKQKQIVINVRE